MFSFLVLIDYIDCKCVPLLQKIDLQHLIHWKIHFIEKKAKKQNNISSESHYNTFKYKFHLCHMA